MLILFWGREHSITSIEMKLEWMVNIEIKVEGRLLKLVYCPFCKFRALKVCFPLWWVWRLDWNSSRKLWDWSMNHEGKVEVDTMVMRIFSTINNWNKRIEEINLCELLQFSKKSVQPYFSEHIRNEGKCKSLLSASSTQNPNCCRFALGHRLYFITVCTDISFIL